MKIECTWCGSPVVANGVIVDGKVIHEPCVHERSKALLDGVASLPSRHMMFVFVETACTLSDPPDATRPMTFAGFIERFIRRRAKPTERMEEMLREAYLAGAIDGARAMQALYAMGKKQ